MAGRVAPLRRLWPRLDTAPFSHAVQSLQMRSRTPASPLCALRPASTGATPTESPPRPDIARVYGRAFAKVFLGAMFTFQVLYWGWERLRTDELRAERLAEIADLEAEVAACKAQSRR